MHFNSYNLHVEALVDRDRTGRPPSFLSRITPRTTSQQAEQMDKSTVLGVTRGTGNGGQQEEARAV
ncbi:hypothetical protein CCMA1212_008872 [Trichoderma ghanense]|uniref:Uncharacterized protein n=1 Tax=Trichoderma ghanense TaxID=65468 RepID=A0ABY2GUA7_9HYPO